MTAPRARATAPASRGDTASRELLLKAADALMTESGSANASLHAIARRAGVTAPLATYHFGSKQGLLLALVERVTGRSRGQMAALLALDVDARTRLRLHITGIVRTYARHPWLLALLNQLLRGPDEAAAARVKAEFVAPLIDTQRRIIEDGIATGQFRAVDPEQLYFIIIGACQYLFSARATIGAAMGDRPAQPAFARSFAGTVADIVMGGLNASDRDLERE
ncbi:MAG: TetR family transcriptional regulator [Sphingomonas adhaesiva]|uniref:TetR family transcriptional regulator n=1 Tax=Sphingomonas adhaesiva TaxID=28212 RepID=UPI002FF9323B